MQALIVFLLARALDNHRVARKGQTVIDVNLEFAKADEGRLRGFNAWVAKAEEVDVTRRAERRIRPRRE